MTDEDELVVFARLRGPSRSLTICANWIILP